MTECPYWRPGCPFCMRMDRALAKYSIPATVHNIWQDPGAAAALRSIANGNETVPTIVVGPAAMVNPRIDEVIEALEQHAPHLAPAERPKRLFRRR